MRFHILTLFPQMVLDGLNTSITGRAVQSQRIEIKAIDIRDFSQNKHKKVDDYPYGGGAGMVMQAQPIFDAYQSIVNEIGYRPRTIYLTPQGQVFQQAKGKELACEEDLVFLCGHYEGVDERVLEEIVTDYISIGDYVLTGGELPAMVMIDVISRLIPGVLSNEESGQTESLEGNLLEYPQYSRPEVWNNKKVPEVLMSGHHQKIEEWRKVQSIRRTQERRPDLFDQVQLTDKEKKMLAKYE